MLPAPARLRPGVHVIRRDAEHVQLGLDPPHRVILAADPGSLALVEQLRHGAYSGPLDAAQARVLRDLRAADLLIDVDEVPVRTGTVTVHDLDLDHDRGHDRGRIAARITELLADAGVQLSTTGPADLVVTCASGPLPRATVDPWVGEGTPHLVVCGTGHPGSLRVGPLVEPGLTACLRCIDAADSVDDPRRQLLVEQLAACEPAPIDLLTIALATAWAARDVTAYLAGRPAATWSATVDAHEPLPVVRPRTRHPDCGCCWDELPY